MKTRVYVYGLCDVFYDGFYIQGIREVFKTFTFNISKFPKFKQGTFAVIIEKEGYQKKIIIDSADTNNISNDLLTWSDVYGKINYNNNNLPIVEYEKIVPIGPSFGIKIWSLFDSAYYMVSNIIRFQKSISYKREFAANYWRQYKRLPLKEYNYIKSSRNEVFFINSIWKTEKATNDNRAMFIEVCKNIEGLGFEGGFASRKNGDNLGYDKFVYSKIIPFNIYLKKIKNSMVVFNTPAVLSCHGWKLAEFLALGKAIISTHHHNVLPSDLVDNEHVVYVNDSSQTKKTVVKLMNDVDFKHRLEFQARKYFDQHLAPKQVIEKLCNKNY